MSDQRSSDGLRHRIARPIRRMGRKRLRAAIGLTLAAALAVPGGMALADTVQKIDPPAPVVPKMDPPAPAVTESEPPLAVGGDDANTETQDTGSSDTAGQNDALEADDLTEPSEDAADLDVLDDLAGEDTDPDQSGDSDADQPKTDPATDPETQAEIAAEPTESSAKTLTMPGESLSVIDKDGLDQKGAGAKGVSEDNESEATATGAIAMAGSKAQAKADYVIVGLSAPLDTSDSDVHVVGASWDALPKGVSVKVELRELTKGTWGKWHGLELDSEGSPDGGVSAKRQSTEPYVSVAASDLQVRLLTSDGSVPKRASVDLIGDDVSTRDKSAVSTGKDARMTIASTATTTLGHDETASLSAAPAVFSQPNDSGGIVSADTGELTGDSEDAEDAEAIPVLGKASARPTIKSRAAWRAKRPSEPYDVGAVKGMVIHHTAGSNSYRQDQVPAILRSIQQYHMGTRGWRDIGYNFLIDKFGTIWEGRAGGVTRAVVGAQALHMNYTTSGVSVLGTYSDDAPPSAALNSLGKLIAWKLSYHGVSPAATMVNRGKRTSTIIGHRDAPGNATSCPGDAFYAKLGWLRSYVRNRTVSSFTFNGKGAGHGVGLSLYGARTLAAQGMRGAPILRYYFPGAQVEPKARNPLLKVQIIQTRKSTRVTRKSGSMRLTVGAKKYQASSIRFFMVGSRMYAKVGKRTLRAPAAGFQVQWTGTKYWRGRTGVVQVQNASRDSSPLRYRYGRLLVTRIDGRINIVNQLRLNQEYVSGVSLVPSNWPRAALQSAAVVARTKALRTYYDLKGRAQVDCNCQLKDEVGLVFRGWTKAGQAKYGAAWRSAVNSTENRIMTYRTYLARINVTASTGGSTLAMRDAFGQGSLPYLSSRPDPYSLTRANPYRSWSVKLTPVQVGARLGMTNVVELKVLNKTASGAVTSIEARSLDGKTKVISGTTERIRKMLGLSSAYFTVSRR